MLVQASGLTKSFRAGDETVRVLDGVDLTLAPGESLALTGESGSGKSTLLHLVAGLDSPDTGRLLVDGTDLVQASDAARAALRRDVAVEACGVIRPDDDLAAVAIVDRIKTPHVQSC